MAVESVSKGGTFLVFAALACLATACGTDETDSATLPAPVGGTAQGGMPATAGPETTEPTDCPLAPTLDASQTARLSLRAPVEFGAAPLELGTSVSTPAGGSYKLTFFSYYLGNFQLIDSSGAAHAAILVDAADKPLPYGLQLVNMDDEATEQLRLAVAPGNYRSLRFGVGVHQACNVTPLEARSWPLTIESEMDWGWTMLHLRLEGFHDSSGSSTGFMWHLGFPQEYRTVEVASALDLSQGSLAKTLPLAADQLLGVSTPEVTVDESQFLKNLVGATFSLR